MHFGMFMEFGLRDGESATSVHREAFREGLNLIEAADVMGLDSAWLSEFHFMPDRSVLSSPVVTAAAAASRTKRIRIGIAVYVLPLANPLRVAEEIATLDQLSDGRFDFGVGRSGFVNSYNAYGIDYAQSEARFDEALALIRQAFTGERFSFEGAHYQVRDAIVVPQPLQKPYPPMRMAATSPATFEKVARAGMPLFVGLRGDGLTELSTNIARYREVWSECGHDAPCSVFLRVPVYAARDREAAYAEPRECIIYYFERQARLMASQGAKKDANDRSSEKVAAALAALRYEDILASRVAFGDPAQLIERIREWQEVLTIDGIIMEPNAGGLLTEFQVSQSMQVIAEDVMPAFK